MLLSALLAGCMFSGDSGGDSSGAPYPGMKKLQAKGKSFDQGAEGPLASAAESPVMTNTFTYDWWMDGTEVTQGEFAALMGWNPVPEKSPHGQGDEYPVYEVTWYDAALYCNARSRKAGLDTVYAFRHAEKAASGSAYGLAGLEVRFDKAGFRLPTEAEWEYAAKAGGRTAFPWGDSLDEAEAGRIAWYEANAENSSHPVASLQPNRYGLYDLAGNVMEWVNDWKAAYPKAGSENFAGGRDPGLQGEKPVKGGAYSYGIRHLRPAGRTATYATTPSSKASYVGFRAVLGAVPEPRFTTRDGNFLQTDPVALASLKLPRGFAGRRAKLAFINASETQRNLAYVDYGQFPPLVHEFSDVNDAFYPAVSPDGQWVAYGTAPEGADTGSRLFIRKLDSRNAEPVALGQGFIPRWWVDEAAQDTFLIYATSAVSNLENRWSASATLTRKIKGGMPEGEPSALVESGGYHDGRSRGGRWLATGYQLLRVHDLEKQESRILFTAPENGKSEGDTSQVCNVSMAPDSSGRVLFLDFGFPSKSAITGYSYGIHQVAFLADPGGKVLRWYRVPAGEASWDEMEWSNDPGFAVSSARDGGDRHRHLYLLDLGTGGTELLATGTSLLQPSLWVDPDPILRIPGGLDPDSLGIYNDPPSTVAQFHFADKMKKFWKGRRDWEILAVGSSHTHFAIDPSGFSGGKAFNFGYMGNDWTGTRTLALDYFLNLCPSFKVVIIEVFAQNLSAPEAEGAWVQAMAKTKGVLYDRSHDYWRSGVPPQLDGLIQSAPNPSVNHVDSAGWERGVVGEGWGASPPPTLAHPPWSTDDADYRTNLEGIREAATLLADRKIHVWFVNFPQSPDYRNTAQYQYIGPSWETGKAVMRDMAELEKISPYVHFHDAYRDGDHDYAADEAMDWDHLNGKGAAKLTRRLDSLIANGLAGTPSP